MIKLIATDMDGTFLDSNKQFDPKFFKLFEELKEKNICFVVASGNQCFKLLDRFAPIKDEIYYIAENGSYTLYGQNDLHSTIIDKQDFYQILSLLQPREDCFFIVCTKIGAYILNEYRHREDIISKYYAKYYFVDNFDCLQEDVLKISFHDDHFLACGVLEEILPLLPQETRAITTGFEWIDITNKNIHKGIALKQLQDDLNILPEECAAFGDQMNDLELLQQVKYSYAMDNALPEIKAIAYEVIGDNDSQAVIKKIEEILKQQ